MRSIAKLMKDWQFTGPNGVTTAVELPHTWNARDGQDGGNDYWRGCCTYCTCFAAPVYDPAQQQVWLQFEGINASAAVLLNGQQLCTHDGGYSTFRAEVTELLQAENQLTVRVDNSVNDRVYPQKADFTFYGGIYRDVSLLVVNKNHIALGHFGDTGVKITPTLKEGSADIRVETLVEGSGTVTVELLDAEGRTAAKGEGENTFLHADVPFRITSKTTGENHVVVTDDNGQFSTSADWASHKHNTNAGKTSEDGVWFGTSEPDDSKGALPYDTYIIEEMRCDSNKGFELIPPFEIVVSRNNLVIDLGTLTDEYEKEISIHTTATSKDGEKTILAGKEVTIVDTVKLDGLTKGTKYQLKGWQMLKEENAELIIDGKRVENDYTFVADDEEMKVEISYTFNASALGGKNLVTFEELYDFSNPDEPVKVAEHKDIEDDGQTVLITERIIKIHTTATDKDGNKELKAGKDVTIIDTVTLEGLEIGTQYKLVGWQMLKEENAELLINGKRVESDYTFIADSKTMKVEVAFTFDATSLDGKQLVTFEELYDLSNPDEPKKVTEHKDIEDKGQTITFKEKPEEPEKPETPPTPEKPNRPSDSPKTGDSTNVMAFIVMLLASAGGLAGTYLYKRRKMKKS